MTTFNHSVYDDPKIQQALEMLEQGRTREEIANHFGNKTWKSIDKYFRTRDFYWDGITYVPKEEESTTALEEARFVNTKAGQIVRQLNQKFVDIRQVAKKNGFNTMDDMGEYMKSQGYVWNHTIENYDYDETMVTKLHSKKQPTTTKSFSPETLGDLAEYKELLEYLMSKQQRLEELLEIKHDGTLPRYKFKGTKSSKTFGLPNSLQTLLNDFSKEYNVTQRDIIEVALAEFLKKYGYEHQLNSVIQA